jgi:hypothetical protein
LEISLTLAQRVTRVTDPGRNGDWGFPHISVDSSQIVGRNA